MDDIATGIIDHPLADMLADLKSIKATGYSHQHDGDNLIVRPWRCVLTAN